MSDDDITFVGEHIGYGGQSAVPFGIRRADRRHHLYAIGKTGTGKSTLLERLITQDIEAGEGVVFLDPHGDSALRLLDHIPPSRTDHVCYFDPADLAYPVGFNILSGHDDPERRHLAVAGAVSAFKGFWGESWGPRLEYILANALAALMELPGATLLSLPRLLTDDAFRVRAGERLHDPVVRRYWLEEFATLALDKRMRAEATSPVLNKVGQLFMSPMMRNIFGQERSGFDARFIMDHRRILIANLSRGRIGAANSALIGSLLVSAFELAATSRADVPEAERVDCYLYADEFQHFATESFASILSEARKYRLALSLFHQYEDQLEEPILRAVFGNVGTLIVFQVGQRDAEHLSREFEHDLTPEDLTALDRFHIAVRMLERGRQSVPFRGRTSRPNAPLYGRSENIMQQSRMRFARPREKVERAIGRLMA